MFLKKIYRDYCLMITIEYSNRTKKRMLYCRYRQEHKTFEFGTKLSIILTWCDDVFENIKKRRGEARQKLYQSEAYKNSLKTAHRKWIDNNYADVYESSMDAIYDAYRDYRMCQAWN